MTGPNAAADRLSLSETLYLANRANRVMIVADDSANQIAVWCAHWAVALQRTA